MKSAERPAAYRYALYFAPAPGSAWDEAGSLWLGRSAAEDLALPQQAMAGVAPAQLATLTASPRRYGWHATLRAPFELAPGVAPERLLDAVRHLAQGLASFAMPALAVRRLDDFLALVPQDPRGPAALAIAEVERTLLTGLHPLAAALGPDELERRRAAGLSAEEDALLRRWGYPFVLDRFRFHLSLTGSLRGVAAPVVQAIEAAARRRFEPLPPLAFDAVTVFAEPTRGADFVCLERVGLAG
jgi:hypothetical protein